MSHHQDANFLKKHIKVGNDTEGGACLNRHEKRAENSCSHIWQAQKKAETEDRPVYMFPKYKDLCGKTFQTGARLNAAKTAIFPRGMALTDAGPKPYEWDPSMGQNFKDWRKPYWHNAHHIVPNAVLNSSISDAAADTGDSRIALLVRSGLLGAKYNLNHKKNMIILPMGQEVAAGLKLPRHLVGDKPSGTKKKEFRSHKDYSAEVKNRVRSVITDYIGLFDADPKQHVKPPNELAKEKLEKCSTDIHSSIISFGAGGTGAPISDMPADLFKEKS
jgi:hypothetical protein